MGRVLAFLLCVCSSLGARAEPVAERPLRNTELVGWAGLLSTGFAFREGGSRSLFPSVGADGRYRWRKLLVEGGLMGALPVQDGPSGGGAATFRVGASGSSLAGSLGASLQIAPGPAPVSPLPSLLGSARLGPVIGSVGVFDRSGLVPVRIGVEWWRLSLSYLLPLGGEVAARIPTGRSGLEVDARLWGFSLYQVNTFMVAVGVAFDPQAEAP